MYITLFFSLLFFYTQAKTLPNSSSPFRRWGQSSFRSRTNDAAQANFTNGRQLSLVASESDVHTKVSLHGTKTPTPLVMPENTRRFATACLMRK